MSYASSCRRIAWPGIDATRADGWIYFVHLYAKVIEDCPLLISGRHGGTATIVSATVNFELGKRAMGEHMPFKVTWTVLDKNGLSGDIAIFNTFRLTP